MKSRWYLLVLLLPLLFLVFRPDLSLSFIHTITGEAVGIPRSVAVVKWKEWRAAWTPGEVASLSKKALSGQSKLRPMFIPDLSGYDLPHRLGIQPGEVVADIGCGTGALEVALLEEKIPFQRLYAIDIDARSLEVLARLMLLLEGGDRVHVLLVEPGSLGVEKGTIDRMVVDTVQLHQGPADPDPWTEHPEGVPAEVVAMLSTLKAAMKPGGTLVVIENLPANQVPEPPPTPIRSAYEAAGFLFQTVERLNDSTSHSGAWMLRFQVP